MTVLSKKTGADMRLTSKGQVTIPQAVRETAGLLPNTEVDIVLEDGKVTIRKARSTHPTSRGACAVRGLRGRAGGTGMTTDEIMALTRSEP